MKLSQGKIDELKKELEYLKTHGREKANVALLSGGGMLASFNDNANLQQELHKVDIRIAEVKTILLEAEVLPGRVESDKVVLGSWVKVKLPDGEKKFRMVETAEAGSDKISIESPLGKALLNKKVGNSAEWETPMGKQKAQVIEIS